MGDGVAVRPEGRGRKTGVRWSPGLAARLCARVAAGELLYVVCREPGMPTPQTVGRWARERADFRAQLAEARRACGRTEIGGGVFRYNEGLAREVYARLCDGESLTKIGADPTMPCLSTLFYWRRNLPEFEATVQLGMRVRAERFCDMSWEMAQAATPETAYLTHVRLGHLRWMAGTMAPWAFRQRPGEPQKPAEPPKRLLQRHFTVEIDPETGEKQVVGWRPNPDTGQVEREDAPGWRPPPNSWALPG